MPIAYVCVMCVFAAFSVFLSMLSRGQVHVLNAGQSIVLDCEFYAEEFSMFNNPVIWKKFQRQEQLEVNIMGNILPPFFSTGRFRVTLTTNPPRYRLQLSIAGWSNFGDRFLTFFSTEGFLADRRPT